MKKILLTMTALMTISGISMGAIHNQRVYSMKSESMQIPHKFMSTSETTIYEWGCPVSELVVASSGAEAISRVGRECMEEAKRAASSKPDVFDVIRANIIVPDIYVSEDKDAGGFMLTGTFFVETLVLKGMGGIK